MQIIMTRAAAATIRATKAPLPGYGLSSLRTHCRIHSEVLLEAGMHDAIDAMSSPAKLRRNFRRQRTC